jgi:hypothetical protein
MITEDSLCFMHNNDATKSRKHKISPNLMIDLRTLVYFRALVFWWQKSIQAGIKFIY